MHAVKKVLIIDDDPSIREIIRFLLEDAGYEVLEASDGEIGLDVIDRNGPFVVLVDLLMPRVDGFGVMKVVESNPTLTAKHRYVIITANRHALPDSFERILAKLEVPVLFKPFDLADLLQVVNQAATTLSA